MGCFGVVLCIVGFVIGGPIGLIIALLIIIVMAITRKRGGYQPRGPYRDTPPPTGGSGVRRP